MMKKNIVIISLMTLGLFSLMAQKASTNEERQYLEVLKKRSEKILDQYVELPEGKTKVKVLDLMVKQYWDLNKVHEKRDNKIKELKESGVADDFLKEKRQKIEKKADRKLLKLQKKYLRNLSKLLDKQQIDGIKEGMTLGAMTHNYKGFTEMIPTLTSEEKEHIRTQLLEARDKAMNMGSSEDKQAVFRNYKGKINNYLSGRGYDLEKEGKQWQERIKASK